jgi:hypothetical protein
MGQVMDGNCFIETRFIIRASTNTRPRAASDISKYVFGNFTTFKAEFLQPVLSGCRRYYRAARVALRPPFHIARSPFSPNLLISTTSGSLWREKRAAALAICSPVKFHCLFIYYGQR